MLNFLKRLKYQRSVESAAMALLMMLGEEGKALCRHAGIKEAVREGHKAKQSPESAAVFGASLVLGSVIDGIDGSERKQAVFDQLEFWSRTENPRSIRTAIREGTAEYDGMFLRLAWAILMALDWRSDGLISQADFDLLKSEIYGSLSGVPQIERSNARIRTAIHEFVFQNPT